MTSDPTNFAGKTSTSNEDRCFDCHIDPARSPLVNSVSKSHPRQVDDYFMTLPQRVTVAHNRPKQLLRWVIHLLSYHFILKSSKPTATRVADFSLVVWPTVFHPRYFRTSAFFAKFLLGIDSIGKRVADVGTGSGILALAAARGGAASVIAVDINPNAAKAAAENARINGFGHVLMAISSDLLSALEPRPLFDIIISSPPSFPGKPRDLADRAWHARPAYRDIAMLFIQARERLAAGGRMYVLFSSDSDLDLLGSLISRAGFVLRLVAERSILFESMLIFELTAKGDKSPTHSSGAACR